MSFDITECHDRTVPKLSQRPLSTLLRQESCSIGDIQNGQSGHAAQDVPAPFPSIPVVRLTPTFSPWASSWTLSRWSAIRNPCKVPLCGALHEETAMAAKDSPEGTPSNGEPLPKPDAPFDGKIGRTVKDSKPDFPKGLEAPAGAPNVLMILTDDVGFGASSVFGGPIPTPNFQRVADRGL